MQITSRFSQRYRSGRDDKGEGRASIGSWLVDD